VSDLPKAIEICEKGPREGMQIEKGPISTERKIELIDALSDTGLALIQAVSFVNPKRVPSMADADAVISGITPRPGVQYSVLWLNDVGLERALKYKDRINFREAFSLGASEAFSMRNQNRNTAENIAMQNSHLNILERNNIHMESALITAAFGCNFAGDIPISSVLATIDQAFELAAAHNFTLKRISLNDTMAWATPESVKRMVGAVRDRWPALRINLHFHDTRGLGVANFYAGLEMGVESFDSSVAGLGGCPFAGHRGASGNVCTEDLVFLCEELGIHTGVDLDRLIECALLAEDIVGHPLPGSVMKGGTLRRLREESAKKNYSVA
jgi:hydroxymethylglutaryl-CoA lyase